MADIVVKGDNGTQAIIETAQPAAIVVSGTLQGPAGPPGPPGANGINGTGGGGSGGALWGDITGALTDQTDLVTALANKLTGSSNLSDIPNLLAARTNLGVAIGADVQAEIAATLATDYYRGDKVFADLNTVVRANRLDQMTGPANPVNMLGQRLISAANPISDQDAATKKYVDSVVQGLNVKSSVQAATAAALAANTYSAGVITASANGALVVDGVTVSVNDHVLVKDETSQLKNGIYTVTATGDLTHPFILTRSTDMDSSSEIAGAFTFVTGGTANANGGYVVAAAGPFTIGTTAIPFTQFSSSSVPDATTIVKGKATLGATGGAATFDSDALKAVDTAVVHNTGAETVAGIKTFSSAPVVPSAAFPESAVTNLTTDLAAKAPTSRTISTTAPLTGGGDLSADRTLAVSDATPSSKGVIELAGDLGGTAASPTVKNLMRVFNVKDYGAVGDGVADNHTAYTNITTAINSNGGGILYIPQGSYYSSLPLTPGSFTTIQGDGIDQTILLPSTSNTGGNGDGIRVVSSSNHVTVRDLTVDCSAQYPTLQLGSVPVPSSNGVTLQQTDDARVERVKVIKPSGYGVNISSASGNGPFVKRPVIRDLYVEGERGGYDSLGGGGIVGGLIDGLYVYPAADGTNPYGTVTDWTDMWGTIIRNVRGWTTFVNGVTPSLTPAIPVSGKTLFNPFAHTVTIVVTGTVTSCTVNQASVGTGGTYTLPGFGQIKLTYSGTASWVWTAPTAPTMPASTVNATNPFDFPVGVTVTGGTVTAVVVNGITQGAITGYFLVPVAGTISLTYSVAPTWSWKTTSNAGAIQTDFGAVNVLWQNLYLNGFHDGIIISSSSTKTQPSNVKVANANIFNVLFNGMKTNVSSGNGFSGIDIVDSNIGAFGVGGSSAGIQLNGCTNFSVRGNTFGPTVFNSYCVQLQTDGVNNCDYGVVANNNTLFNSSFYTVLTSGAGSNVTYVGNPGVADSYVSSTGSVLLAGTSAKTFGMNPGASQMFVQGSAAALQALNANGGLLTVKSGQSTGSGGSTILFQVAEPTIQPLTALAAVTANNVGSGYVVGDVLTVTGGSGTSGTITVSSVAVAGQIATVSPSYGGIGYVVGDTITIPGGTGGSAIVNSVGELGKVLAFTTIIGGSGYTAGSSVAASGGTGTGLLLTTTVYVAGAITGQTISAGGTGYVLTTAATTSGGTGTGATFDIVPYGNAYNTVQTVMQLNSNNVMTLSDGVSIVVGSTSGTKIGTSTTQKLSFFNATPIVRPTGDVLTALSNLGLVASPTLTPSFATLTKYS